MPRKMPTLPEFAVRLCMFLILAVAFTVVYPYLSDMFGFRQPTVEISGLRPGEKIAIERTMMIFYRLEAKADESGKAVFDNVPLGNWRVVEGGTPELRKMEIRVQERLGSIAKGQVRVVFHEGSR